MTLEELIQELIWRVGPGVPAKLIVDEAKFRRYAYSRSPFSCWKDFDGYRCIETNVFGSTVYITCERMRLPAPDTEQQTIGAIMRGGDA